MDINKIVNQRKEGIPMYMVSAQICEYSTMEQAIIHKDYVRENGKQPSRGEIDCQKHLQPPTPRWIRCPFQTPNQVKNRLNGLLKDGCVVLEDFKVYQEDDLDKEAYEFDDKYNKTMLGYTKREQLGFGFQYYQLAKNINDILAGKPTIWDSELEGVETKEV